MVGCHVLKYTDNKSSTYQRTVIMLRDCSVRNAIPIILTEVACDFTHSIKIDF
jgi:hypothetical protein